MLSTTYSRPMRKWLRDNYGWQVKKREWSVLAFGLMVAATIGVILAMSA